MSSDSSLNHDSGRFTPLRISSLDGLRGVAALTVVAHHTLECLGDFAQEHLKTAFLTLGQQCVWLFFVISGVVLSRSALRPDFTAGTFLISRVVRLYLPTAAAATLTYISMLVVSRRSLTGNTWIDSHPKAISLSAIASDFSLVDSTSGNLMPLWSLKWEMLYSAFLLVFLVIAKSAKWQFLLLAGVWIGSSGLGALPFYASMFLIGTVIGVKFDSFEGFLRSRTFFGSFVTLAGLAFIGAGNFLQGWTHLQVSGNFAILLSLVGITGLVISAETSILGPFLRSRTVQFLGLISFSLYLVHEPILIAAARLGRQNPWITIAASIVSVGFAYLFYKIIEKRAHVLSRSLRTKAPNSHQELTQGRLKRDGSYEGQ